jgi:cell division protein FtsI (penicillin-binding protein 3)
VLAVSSPVKSIWAIPEDARLEPIPDSPAGRPAGGWRQDELNQKLSSEKDFVYLKRQVSPGAGGSHRGAQTARHP